MASVTRSEVKIEVRAKVILELDEEEARALSGIFGYSVEAFLKVFYERMGSAYVKPFEAGVRRLHETVRGAVAGPLAKADDARRVIRAATQTQPRQ